MNDLVVKNGTIITMDPDRRIIDRGTILIRGNSIHDVISTEKILQETDAEHVIDADHRLIFPGLINTHTHTFQALLRGIGQDLPVWEWFENTLDKVVGCLTPQDCYLAAKISAIEAIKSGTTTILDYNYPHPLPNLDDHVIRGFLDVGIRSILARGVVDTGDVHKSIVHDTEFELEECKRLIHNFHGKNDGLTSVWLAPYTIFSTHRDTFIKLKEMADYHEIGVSVHAATPSTIEAAQQLYGMGDIEFEESIHFLGPNVLLVHCVNISDHDFRILKAHNVKVSHNPASNCYLGEGIAPIRKMIDNGIVVGLGTDGPASNNNQDLLAILKLTALLQKVDALEPTAITAEKVLEMATIDGARCLGLEKSIGSIEIGKKADLIIVDPWKPNSIALHDPVANLVYSCTQENVETVIVNGKIIMKNRQILSTDELSTLLEVQMVSEGLLDRAGLTEFRKRPWRTRGR